MTEYKRLTINVSSDLAAEMEQRAERLGITLTDWLKRAVALQRFVEDNGPRLEERSK